jgi:hypothetical protein
MTFFCEFFEQEMRLIRGRPIGELSSMHFWMRGGMQCGQLVLHHLCLFVCLFACLFVCFCFCFFVYVHVHITN